MDCALPCDVHMPLEREGRIKNVVEADYSFDAEWIERRSWWFLCEFEGAEADMQAEAAELTLESLDAYADVFLNGEWLGTHRSAHFPFVAGVKDRIRSGINVIAVRLTTGLEQVSDRNMAELNWACCHEEGNGCPERGDRRRSFVRKPQYTVGWDWGPKAPTCGIVKNAYITFYSKTAIRGAHLVTKGFAGGGAELDLTLTIDQLHVIATRDADISVKLLQGGRVCALAEKKDVLLTSGENFIDIPIHLEDAQLWWPAGFGAQPLYEVRISAACGGHTEEYPPFRYGVRTVGLDISRTDEKRRNFNLIINSVPVFCKGGDWIPADSVYARVTDGKYRALIREAREANFNMLRVWGGGIYERDVFYEACDEEGILIWHDFMFGCSTYPDHLNWFRELADREFEYQVARLRGHPCIALWCGNNEDHMIFDDARNPDWKIKLSYEKQYGLYTSNVQAKRAVRRLSPEIPYWNSSPYGGEYANSDDVGDVHHWDACMMNRDINKRIEPREYDKIQARFVTEYGYPGPCPMESIHDYFAGSEINRSGRVWDLHNNTFEKHTVNAGIEKHYLDGAKSLSLEQYILYAGMVQSLMLGYSLEAIRFKDYCGGGLFWMYNDTWGEVGWTIIDYYLRRKISFYGVKRAFAPIKLTLREENGRVILQGLNDTAEAAELDVSMGYMSFDGKRGDLSKAHFTLKPHSRPYIWEGSLPYEDYTEGTFIALPDNGIEPAVLRLHDIRGLKYPGASVKIERVETSDEGTTVTMSAGAFIHGVYVQTNLKCSDNYFDLVPGQKKTVTVYGWIGEAPEWKTLR